MLNLVFAMGPSSVYFLCTPGWCTKLVSTVPRYYPYLTVDWEAEPQAPGLTIPGNNNPVIHDWTIVNHGLSYIKANAIHIPWRHWHYAKHMF